MTDSEIYANLLKTVFKVEVSSKSEKKSKTESLSSDTNLEISIREIISKKLPILNFKSENIEEGKEFIIFHMELFDSDSKILLCSNYFFNEEFYGLKNGEDTFFIQRKDLSKLYYYNIKTKNKKIIIGFEEKQQTSKDNTKFYFTEKETNNLEIKNSEENEGLFLNEIKFNLISKETTSLIGENKNIPEEFLDDYYEKSKLLCEGNNLFALCTGRDKEFEKGEGVIHYPMKNYYIKLSSIKGEFEGIYTSQKDFNLHDFHCRIIFSQFDIISENSIILFEFKNGKSGENKIIIQAINYQKNAKVIFKDQKFYHIIIIRAKELGDKLKEKINEELIRKNKFINFAVLCMDNSLSICNEALIPSNKTKKEESNQSNEENEKIERQISELKNDLNNIKDKLDQLILEIRKLNNTYTTKEK